MFDKWKELLVEGRSVIDKARDIYRGENLKIAVGMVECGNMKDVIVKGLIRFNEKYPDLEVEYGVYTAREMLDALDAGSLHIGFCFSHEAKNRPDLSAIAVKNHYEEIGLVFANYHSLAEYKKIDLGHVAKETIGVISKNVTIDHFNSVQNVFLQNGITDTITYKEYNSPYSLQMALVTGKCVTVMYHYILDGAEDKLQFYPLDVNWAEHDISIIYRDTKYATKAKNIAEEFE